MSKLENGAPHKQQGVALLEALIAVLIFSIGILAVIGLQATSVRLTTDAKYRADASFLANQALGRVWADPGNLAAYVEANTALAGYTDANYATFADNNKTRQSVVYAGGNDGMLHAFNGETGVEMWAFVPSAVIPNLYKLADKSYGTNHRFYVDGPITVGDVCLATTCAANQWKTMLVGGLGKGGRVIPPELGAIRSRATRPWPAAVLA